MPAPETMIGMGKIIFAAMIAAIATHAAIANGGSKAADLNDNGRPLKMSERVHAADPQDHNQSDPLFIIF